MHDAASNLVPAELLAVQGRIVQPGNECRRGQPFQAAMRPTVVVLHAPLVENDPSLRQAREPLTVTVYLPGPVPLRTSVLSEYSTDPSFRDLLMPQRPPDGFHRPAATLGAYQLSCATQACGRAASLRISLSNAWSATSFFSLEFSFWSS